MQLMVHFIHVDMPAEAIYRCNLRFLLPVGSPSTNTEGQHLE